MNNGIAKAFQSIRLQSFKPEPLQLKVGQIITGKLEKFLPQNRAMIHIGNQTVIAELKNQLLANHRYLFQVKHVLPFVNLQVISEKPIRNEKDSIQHLLNKFGIKSTDTRMNFLSLFLKEDVPIREQDIKQAIQLLEGEENSDKAKMVILEMIKRHLPISKGVYDALFQRMFHTIFFSETVNTLREYVNNTNVNNGKQLLFMLSALQQNDGNQTMNKIYSQMIQEVLHDNHVIFSLLQKMGSIDKNMTYSIWKDAWIQFARENNVNTTSYLDTKGSSIQAPSNLIKFENVEQFYQAMSDLWGNRHTLTMEEKNMLNLWLMHGIPVLEKEAQIPLKKSFLIRLEGFLSMLNAKSNNVNSTLPELLKLLLKDSNHSAIHQEGKQLLQILNGMQLTLEEGADFQQFSVQIPSGLFGLKKDMFLDFEGKMKGKNKLNENYCRVMFYLELESLKETVIDMNVQNRIVNLTIYHERPMDVSPIIQAIQPGLTSKLKDMNYIISSVTVKSIKNNPSESTKAYMKKLDFTKGVDLQV